MATIGTDPIPALSSSRLVGPLLSGLMSLGMAADITGLPRGNDRKRRSQTAESAVWHIPVIAWNPMRRTAASCLVTLLRSFPRDSHRSLVEKPGESLATSRGNRVLLKRKYPVIPTDPSSPRSDVSARPKRRTARLKPGMTIASGLSN